ncbi:MAG TPA: polyprenyl diphosphate synthase [Candidatus Humimicrobiaceae bacterium]|nr:polyprenyl diphosphate synthase [Candidatus Humimicrobiaceae bacterium]
MTKVPNHLGIILDGNRRWAKERGLPVFEGHRKGLETVKKVINYCKEKGIRILTLFVFSTENWERGKEEVGWLMRLARRTINSYLENLHKSKIRVKVIGQREKLSRLLQKEIAKIEKITKDNTGMTVNFALSYGGRAEIVAAVKKIIKNKIPLRKVSEDTIKENLWTSDVDLIIRTGREQRISNFLIWQAAYSELYFYPKYWPDFSEQDLDKAIAEYSRRQRRFGQ